MEYLVLFALSLQARAVLQSRGKMPAQVSASSALVRAEDRVVIEEKKVILTRGKKGDDYKEATISYPVVRGLKNRAALSKVQSALSLKNVFGSSLEDLRVEFRESRWLSEIDYEVNYNQDFILDITFSMSGVGAYPDTVTEHRVINLKTGERLKAADVFKPRALKTIATMVNQAMQAEIKRTIAEWAKQGEDIKDRFEDVQFQERQLDDFSVSDKGVIFLYKFGFPHVSKALEPPGKYFFSFDELKAYIKRDGLLGVFIQ